MPILLNLTDKAVRINIHIMAEYTSTHSTGYIPVSFLRSLGAATFDGQNKIGGVTLPWLVRTFHLFEAVSDYLVTRRGLNTTPVGLMDAMANSGILNQPIFSSVTGRLLSYKHLGFVKKISSSITDKELNNIYSLVSNVMKKWDQWYLKNTTVRLNKSLESVAPITINGVPSGSNIMAQGSPYAFGSNPDTYVQATLTLYGVSCKLVTYDISRDSSFESARVAPSSDLNKGLDSLQAEAADTLVIKGAITLEKMEQYYDAKKTGREAVIMPLMSDPNAASPESGRASLQEDDVRFQTELQKSVIKTPVLDWLNGSLHEASEEEDSEQ